MLMKMKEVDQIDYYHSCFYINCLIYILFKGGTGLKDKVEEYRTLRFTVVSNACSAPRCHVGLDHLQIRINKMIEVPNYQATTGAL